MHDLVQQPHLPGPNVSSEFAALVLKLVSLLWLGLATYKNRRLGATFVEVSISWTRSMPITAAANIRHLVIKMGVNKTIVMVDSVTGKSIRDIPNHVIQWYLQTWSLLIHTRVRNSFRGQQALLIVRRIMSGRTD